MRKIYTSLITLAVLLCAIVFASACAPTSNSSVSANSMKSRILLVGPDSAGSSAIASLARNQSVDIVQVSSRAGTDFETANLPPILIAKEIAVLPESPPDLKRMKTETRKSVTSNYRRTFYDEPPELAGYTGMSFANLTRAQPLFI